MLDLTNAIEEINYYKGSEKKKTLVYEANKYLVKFTATIRQKGKNICKEEELSISRLWLSIGNIKKLEKYREKMLGELERLDQETGSEYIRILKCYLETNGNIGEVATECYLHRNTVSYHLKKIAEITGKTLNSTKDRSDWYLAYQIDEFLGLI